MKLADVAGAGGFSVFTNIERHGFDFCLYVVDSFYCISASLLNEATYNFFIDKKISCIIIH